MMDHTETLTKIKEELLLKRDVIADEMDDLVIESEAIQRKINAVDEIMEDFSNAVKAKEKIKRHLKVMDEEDNQLPDSVKPVKPACFGAFEGKHKCHPRKCSFRAGCLAEENEEDEPDEDLPQKKSKKVTGKRHKSAAVNTGITDAMRRMMRGGTAFTTLQIYTALKQRFKKLTRSTVTAVLGFNVKKGRMVRHGQKGSYRYALAR